jgi:hypothetical protein
MARIKLGPVITDIAGSIGGITIQRNRWGITARKKPLPLRSETVAQYNIRRMIIELQASWQNLTDDQRRQWDRFVDFSGQTIRRDRSIRMSGHSIYLKYQLFLLLYDQSLLTEIAYSPIPDWSAYQNITVTEEIIQLWFYYIVTPSTYFFTLKVTSPRLENQAFNPRGLRFMKVPFSESSSFVFTTAYKAAFGVLPPGNSWLHYEIQYFSTTSPVWSGKFTGKKKVIPA